MTTAAILLAAGESTRMGRLKQLLPWGGSTLVAWQVRQMLEAGVDEVIVVLGHEADRIEPALAGVPCRVVVNEAYRQGRASSLRCGAGAVSNDAEAVLVLSVDQPRPAWLSRGVLEAWRTTGALIVSPRFARGFGHPVLLSGSLVPELRQVADETLGLRAVIDRHVGAATSLTVRNSAIDVDLNTPRSYAEALASFDRGEWQADVTQL